MNRKHANPQLHRKQFAFKADSLSDTGTFTGYGSVFGTLDSYREIVAPGAFTDSLKAIKASGDPLPMLWQHQAANPIGSFTSLAEDDRGLKVEGQLLMAIPKAQEAFALMKARIVKGLSIGYYVTADSYNEKDRIRTLKSVELVEVSPVTFAANPDAQIDEVKTRLAYGEEVSLKELEMILREAGFSKTQAARVANSGLPSLYRGEPGSDEKGALVAMLKGISLPSFAPTGITAP